MPLQKFIEIRRVMSNGPVKLRLDTIQREKLQLANEIGKVNYYFDSYYKQEYDECPLASPRAGVEE